MKQIGLILSLLLIVGVTQTGFAQGVGGADTGTNTNQESTVSGSFDQTQAQANQAFIALQSRQFLLAHQQYKQAAGSNPEYQKMVDFVEVILDRMQESIDEQMEIFGQTTAANFRTETLSRDEINRMLDYQFKQMQAGQALADVGIIAEIPVAELGLDFEGAEQMTLGEYLGWIRPRSANQRIWYRARKRALERQVVYARREAYRQQLQEKMQRVEEFRRRRLDTQSGNMGIMGGGGMMGGGMGMMGGGMGGGMGMGGMGGGMGMGGMGGGGYF